MHADILAKKLPYLNLPFFYVRAALVLLFWFWLSTKLVRHSTLQDSDGDAKHTVTLQRLAPVGTIGFGLTASIGGIDWIMSLEPNWYSTMFGVHIFASSAVTIFGLVILMTLGFRKAGLVKNEINVEHFHDLGKLQFGFLVFWAYISFSEFFLIWYAAIPEETAFYHLRWDQQSWRTLSQVIVGLHFILPFFFILSRNIKRVLPALGFLMDDPEPRVQSHAASAIINAPLRVSSAVGSRRTNTSDRPRGSGAGSVSSRPVLTASGSRRTGPNAPRTQRVR